MIRGCAASVGYDTQRAATVELSGYEYLILQIHCQEGESRHTRLA